MPDGFTVSYYQPGDENSWVQLEYELGQFSTVERGLQTFREEFLVSQRLDPRERMIFVRDSSGNVVATAALWDGMYLGKLHPRIHWVAVSDSVKGRGIAKAMISHLLLLYRKLKLEGSVYLWTGTRYYPAVNIYRKFGFTEYRGDVNPITNIPESDYPEQNARALSLLEELLNKYNGRK
jgi:GNAT superfamily N-acetyltransferase